MIVSFRADNQLTRELGGLARDLGFSRAHLCRAILRGVLRDKEGIQKWMDIVLGPRFAFCVVPDSCLKREPAVPEAANDGDAQSPQTPHRSHER
jgi:hypothetical protein